MFTRVKTESEIANMRTSGRILATIHRLLRDSAVPGISELELAGIATRELKSLDGKAPFLGYHGFPNVICISANDKVVHGIPSDNVLKDGDIVSFDFGVDYKGMITDSAFTMAIGSVPKAAEKLMKTTEQSMYAGIDVLKDGVKVGDIGVAVERVLKTGGYGIVRELVGHGVGHRLHEEPDIPNYGTANSGPMLKAGMTIAIEPMANLGSDHVTIDADGWTIRTADGSLSAHFEHTILITKNGFDILTQLE